MSDNAESTTMEPAPTDLSDALCVPEETAEGQVDRLTARIAQLEQELADRAALQERMSREYAEFEQYFPEVPCQDVPDVVWAQVQGGVPLAAAYALYARGQDNHRKQTQEQAAYNAASGAGMPGGMGREWFSPAQVRAMSRQEVRENYDRIMDSMKHWQ